jgi:hypothetical protein
MQCVQRRFNTQFKWPLLTRWIAIGCAVLVGCATVPEGKLDNFEVVDCEIPGAVMRIGAGFSTTGRAQALRTSGSDCAIRGGYFVEASAANYATSLKIWQPRADAGEVDAQYYVGRIYDTGLGRAPDTALAALWYKRASEQGHMAATTALAGLYEKGSIDGRPDQKIALDLYRKAAQLNEPLAFARDVRERDQAIENLKRELESVRRGAEQQSQQLKERVDQRENELKRLRDEAKRLQDSQKLPPPPANAPPSSQRPARATPAQVSDAERAVRDTEVELRRESQRLTSARNEAARAQAAVLAIEGSRTSRPETDDTPRIELIEPSTLTMRGLTTVRVTSNSTVLPIAVRIAGQSPIANVTINDFPTVADANGVARLSVPLKGNTTPVNVFAIDTQGRRALFSFVAVTETVLPQTAVAAAPSGFGNYHALIIGNSRYREWDRLNSPERDGKAIASVLRSRYGFQVRELYDGTRQDIIRELAKLRSALGPRDNLLVYYAGHGHWDKANQRGYWIPVDGSRQNPANWISSADITDQLSVIPAKQVLLVADSCYSGVLVGSVAAQLDRVEGSKGDWLARRAQLRSRKVMSSGNVAQVMDGGAGSNSIFAKQLIDALSKRAEPFEAHELYREVAPRIEQASRGAGAQQDPQYGPLRHAGHEAGDFVFVPKS